jgi:5-methylcytosine-specific restriction endonuclease McrA
VLERDRGCVVCGSRDLLQVHHIVSAADRGPTILGNCVTLCAAHHRAVENGEITIPDRKGSDGLV